MSVSFINKLFKSKSNDDFCTAVVLAAGNSQRMGKDKIIVINISGRGDKDCAAIARYRGEDIHE